MTFRSPNQCDSSHGVSVDHLNRIIVCDSDGQSVQIFDSKGKRIKSIRLVDASGNRITPHSAISDEFYGILVCDGEKIHVFDHEGKFSHSFQPPPPFYPTHIAVNRKGQIIIPAHQTSQILILIP